MLSAERTNKRLQTVYKHFFKRLLDILISSIALLCIGWLLIIVASFLVIVNKGAGVFFLQERPGKDGKIFKVIKFKTMTVNVMPMANRCLMRKDINSATAATMEAFDGTN